MLPGPTNVPPRVMRAMLKPLVGHRGPEFKELFNKLLGKTKKVFETKGDMFILTSSGTGATEAALQNITDDDDKIIVNVNGFFSERLGEAIKAYGGRPIVLSSEWGKAHRVEDSQSLLLARPPNVSEVYPGRVHAIHTSCQPSLRLERGVRHDTRRRTARSL